MTKIAVAVVHGVGVQEPSFADEMIAELSERFAAELPVSLADRADQIVIKPVYWAPVLQSAQNKLWRKVNRSHDLDFTKLRRFMVDFAGDAIAYQPTPQGREVYDSVHARFQDTLADLAREAGGDSPLCVIAHSLGSVIASNFIYDAQQGAGTAATALERAETFARLYTLGSPLAVWSLRHDGFGQPIEVPAPELSTHHPRLKGQWLNFYDKDDVLAYPLKPLNAAYRRAVSRDIAVNVGGLLSSWNPLSHLGYWTDNDVTRPIAKSLATAWKQTNG